MGYKIPPKRCKLGHQRMDVLHFTADPRKTSENRNGRRTILRIAQRNRQKFPQRPHPSKEQPILRSHFFIQTKLSKQSPSHFATVTYPFDISSKLTANMASFCTLETEKERRKKEILELDKITGRSEYYSMFDSRLDALLNEKKN